MIYEILKGREPMWINYKHLIHKLIPTFWFLMPGIEGHGHEMFHENIATTRDKEDLVAIPSICL